MTVRHGLSGELYHSDRGAVGEATHVFLGNGFLYACEGKRSVNVFEMGFGTGLNALLTVRSARDLGISLDYVALELYPLDESMVSKLNYGNDALFRELHAAPWGFPSEVAPGFFLTKYRDSLLEFDFSPYLEFFDVIYFDAFAPQAQPELWTEEVMGRMYGILKPGGCLVTYSAKGVVKRALRAAGFEVARLPGALGKRHMVRAVK